MRRACLLTLIACTISFPISFGSVRVLRVEGAANLSRGFVAVPKNLIVGDFIKIGDTISVASSSFVDLKFDEASQLLRLFDGTAITFVADGNSTGARPETELTILRGKVCGVSSFTNSSSFVLRSKDSSCSTAGPGRVDYFFDTHKAGSLSGLISKTFATGSDGCDTHFFIYPKNSSRGAEPGRLELNDQEALFLKNQLISLESSVNARQRSKTIGSTRSLPNRN